MLWVQSPTGMPATHSSCIGSGGRNRTCVGCVRPYKAGAPLPVRDGLIGGPPRNRTWITPLKRRVSVSLS